MVTIAIEYRLDDSKAWQKLQLGAEEYFELDAGEAASVDSVPHHLDARNHIQAPRGAITQMKVTVQDSSQSASVVFRHSYWAEGKSCVLERVDRSGSKTHAQLIMSVNLPSGAITDEVLRLERVGGWLLPVFHGLYRGQPDGSEEEIVVFPQG